MRTVFLNNKPRIISCASVVGRKENDGNFSNFFDLVVTDERVNKNTWEQAESELQNQAAAMLLDRTKTKPEDVNIMFGGDLLNQCIGTSFGIKKYEIPFYGLYGACSTFAEGLSLASIMVDGGYAEKSLCIASSHFCASERQFRFPLEYGGQRTPTSQWTVTGAGCALISGSGSPLAVTSVTPGKITDLGIKDVNNMGAAMAPSAVDTIVNHFKDRNVDENYYDAVVTGDLGNLGYEIVKEQLKKQGLDLKEKYMDCGNEIFDKEKQDMHAGGSGCGCCASVFSGYIYKKMMSGELNRVLLCATGALMSPTSSFQGESIPGICHGVSIERVE